MAIYFFYLAFYGVLYYLVDKYKSDKNLDSKKSKFFAVSLFVGLVLLYGLRATSVGIDLKQYRYEYENSRSLLPAFWDFKREFGFYYLNLFFYNYNFSWQQYLFVLYFFISGVLVFFMYKYSENLFYSFFVFVTIGLFTMSMSGMRQTLAVCFCLLAFILVDFNEESKNREFKFFPILFRVCLSLFCWTIAVSFHNSAVVFGIFYLVKNLKVKKLWLIIGLLFSLGTLLYGKYLLNIFKFAIPERYESLSLDAEYQINPLVIVVDVFVTIYCIIFMSTENQSKKFDRKTSIFFVFSILNILFLCLSINNNQIGRLQYYFLMANCILIPNTLSKIFYKDREVYFLIISTFCLLYFFIGTYNGQLEIDNYKFFWMG